MVTPKFCLVGRSLAKRVHIIFTMRIKVTELPTQSSFIEYFIRTEGKMKYDVYLNVSFSKLVLWVIMIAKCRTV